MKMFARFGVREYWLLDPDTRTIEVHRLVGATYSRQEPMIESTNAHSAVLEEFVIDVNWVFAVE